ncbi:Translocation and assembly module subunit TamA [Halioglobus japonicus]|nr:Translocation and assembly module subunit TamA [Halioglobus japonicus]
MSKATVLAVISPAISWCVGLLLLFPMALQAATLEYSVEGIKGERLRNVQAYLGAAPETNQDRLNFVLSARSKVRDALQALGYYSADITLDVQRTDPVWSLVITVEQGEPVRIREIDIEITGAAASDDVMMGLLADSGFVVGDRLHHGNFETFRNRLLSTGQQRGYLKGKFSQSRVAVEVKAETADILLHYESGPRFRFGEIRFDEALIDPSLLDSLIPFKPGDYFDQSSLRKLQSNLQKTNYFSSVIVQPINAREYGEVVPIEVRVQAAKRHNFEVGLGYSTDTEERISMTWRTPRINRYGHSQVTRVEYSPVNPSGRFTYSIPISNPLTDVVQLWGLLGENEYGDLKSRQVEAGARREIKEGKWIYGYSLRGLNESWDDVSRSPSHDYLLLGGSVSSRRYTGSLVDPEGGFSQLYTLEGGAQQLASDIDLVRFTAELRYIVTPWPRHRLVMRTEVGAVEISNGDRSDLAPSLSFFAGGNESIRGYAYQSIGHKETVVRPDGSTKTLVVGGDRLAIASFEYQYYFTDKWRGALYVDGGDAFDESHFDAKVGAGFGIHYLTPVGAIRFELANSVSEKNPDWYFHLAIGAEF